MEKIIKENKYAKFVLLGDSSVDCILTCDFRDFDVSIDEYMQGTDEISEQEYEAIYMSVAQACNENGEYVIDCFDGRYTVRKISDVEKIRYDSMSAEEKDEYDRQKRRNELEEELSQVEKEFKELDYIGVKIATGRATIEEYASEIAMMNKYAKRKNELIEKLKEFQ